MTSLTTQAGFLAENQHFPHRFVLREVTPQDVAIIRIHRPQFSNALNPAAMFQLDKAVDAAIHDPDVRGMVITASEPGFVFGADIGFLIRHIEQNHFEPIHAYTRLGNDCFDRIAASPKPVIAAINGHAFGGGLELALACHVRLVVPTASLSLPEVGLGLCPLWGGVLRMKRQIGLEAAKSLIYTGKNIPVREALELGIIHRAMDANHLLKNAVKLATMLADSFVRENKAFRTSENVLRFFENETVDSIFSSNTTDTIDKTLQMIRKQIRSKCYLALKYCERIFQWDNGMTADDKDRAYREVVEHLYRSEDTITALKWKRDKKIGTPEFTSHLRGTGF